MSLEINTLIKERHHVSDDGCDYCAMFIDNWNTAARARSGACYQPLIKPPAVSSPKTETGAVVKTGNHNVYGRKVITGVYQRYHSGRSAVQIAHMLYRVEHLLKRGTSVRREIFRQVSIQPLPAEAEIMCCLAAESKA